MYNNSQYPCAPQAFMPPPNAPHPYHKMGGWLAAGTVFAILVSTWRFISQLMRYFSTSLRVRTYMGSQEYLRLALFTKKAGPLPAVPVESSGQGDDNGDD